MTISVDGNAKTLLCFVVYNRCSITPLKNVLYYLENVECVYSIVTCKSRGLYQFKVLAIKLEIRFNRVQNLVK